MAASTTRLYQAVLRDSAAPISIRLRRTYSEWVARKGFPPIDAGRARDEREVAGARLRVERRDGSGRFTLEEPCDGGVLRTTVTYTESVAGMTGWVVVVVEQIGGAEHVTANAPGFLPAYLRTARITDGGVHLEDGPVLVDEEEVPGFVRMLTERHRRVPVVVVSIDPRDAGAAQARAARLSEATAGAAIVARFTDLRAQDRFNGAVSEAVRVFGGGVRTYVTPFDPAEQRVPNRHRVMGGHTLRDRGDQALEQLIDGIIGETTWRDLPAEVDRTLQVVNRVLAGRAEPREIAEAVQATRQPRDPARQELIRRMMAVARAASRASARTRSSEAEERPAAGAPPAASGAEPGDAAPAPRSGAGADAPPADAPPADADAPALAQIVADTVVKQLGAELETALTLATAGEETARLSRQVRVLAAHVAGLREVVAERLGGGTGSPGSPGGGPEPLAERLRALQEEHDQLLADYTEELANVRRLTARIRHLERKLAEAGRPVYGMAAEDDAFEPGSLAAALLEAEERLPYVRVCDDASTAAQLDNLHPNWSRAWAVKAWMALRALDDFARARSSGEFSGGFYDWCANASADRYTIPTRMIAMRESPSVTNRAKFSTARTFRVPPELDPSGQMLMEAHIKLRAVGYPAPRMYFHDDSGGPTGKIWIGYLGDHLPNTRTN
jgi:hypothetical protein